MRLWIPIFVREGKPKGVSSVWLPVHDDFTLRLPGDDLQVLHANGIEDFDKEQLDEGRQRQAADLRKAQWLPEGSAMNRQWDEHQR